MTNGPLEQSRQFAEACRRELAATASWHTAEMIVRSRETIEESRALLAKADQILGHHWSTTSMIRVDVRLSPRDLC